MTELADLVQRSFDAVIAGDVEPLVRIMADELEWRGVGSGHLWWRRTPS